MKYIIPFLLIVLVLGAFLFYYISEEEVVEDALNREEIVALLEGHETGVEFLEGYSGFQIEEVEVLSGEDISTRVVQGPYKELYEPLSLENDRYIFIKLTNHEKGRGAVGVVDLEEDKLVDLRYLFLISL